MPKLFRDLMRSIPAKQKKQVEDRVRDLLIEMKAADRAKLELGMDWEDLTIVQQKRVIDTVKEELQSK